MLKTAALAIVITGLFLSGTAAAAASTPPPSLYVSIYGADKTPDIDPSDGSVHAFMCLSPAKTVGPADECFAFRPKPEAVNLVRFNTGGSIARSGAVWTERPGGFHFTQKSLTKGLLVITDSSRGITWTLTLPKGASSITTATATAPLYPVVGVGYEAASAGSVVGPQVSMHGLQDNPPRPGAATAVYIRRVDPRLRTDLYSIVNSWNAKAHTLSSADCMELLDAVAATVGASRPAHVHGMTAAAYVDALIKLNK
jgi:hypothetical protein